MSTTYIDNIKFWVSMLVLISTISMSWGFTRADVSNLRDDVMEIRNEIVPRTEMNEIIRRLDDAVLRLEGNVAKMEVGDKN